MSAENSSFKFEPLKANNWLPWKTRIEAICCDKKLMKYLNGTEAKPVAADPAAPKTAETTAITTWEEQDSKARSIIVLNVSDSEMVHVMGAASSADMWKNLKMVKESSGGVARLTAKRKLYRTFAVEGSDIAEHILKLRQVQEELNVMGSAVKDEDFLDILMTSLPESWDIFTTTYNSANITGVKKLTSHDFISAVYDEIRRRTERGTSNDTAMKAVSHSTHSRGTRRDEDKSSIICHNCQKTGHMKKDCWRPGGGKEGQGPKQKKGKGKDRANKAEDSQGKDLDIAYMAHTDFQLPDSSSRDAWWLDSCASTHLCNDRKIFSSYKPEENRTIKGIAGELTVKGSGTVNLQFLVDGKVIRHQVQNVLHTPTFNSNLLSMGRLDAAGIAWSGGGGNLILKTKEIQIIRNRKARTITISQKNYLNTILERFNYSKLNGVSMPLDPNVILFKRDDTLTPPDPTDVKEYQTKLGSIMYASIGTMPQLAYAVQTLSQFSSNPGPEHMTALKRVFRYLVTAKENEAGIVYGGGRQWPADIIGYSDADWASNPIDRKSISGFAFLLGGGAISWSSKKQTSVALSSTEAEYMAASHAARHAIWLQRLFKDIGISIPKSVTLFIDNQSTLSLSSDVMFHQRTKHIDVQYHFLRNAVLEGTISTFYCPTADMVADIMTKALPRPQHQKLTEDLGVLAA